MREMHDDYNEDRSQLDPYGSKFIFIKLGREFELANLFINNKFKIKTVQ